MISHCWRTFSKIVKAAAKYYVGLPSTKNIILAACIGIAIAGILGTTRPSGVYSVKLMTRKKRPKMSRRLRRRRAQLAGQEGQKMEADTCAMEPAHRAAHWRSLQPWPWPRGGAA